MALYTTKGRIAHISDVQSGTSKNGYEWQRCTLLLEVPGFQGMVSKQVFEVQGESVADVNKFKAGDRVEVSWSMYAKEYNEKWYNHIYLVNITPLEERVSAPAKAAPAPTPKKKESLDPTANPDDLPF